MGFVISMHYIYIYIHFEIYQIYVVQTAICHYIILDMLKSFSVHGIQPAISKTLVWSRRLPLCGIMANFLWLLTGAKPHVSTGAASNIVTFREDPVHLRFSSWSRMWTSTVWKHSFNSGLVWSVMFWFLAFGTPTLELTTKYWRQCGSMLLYIESWHRVSLVNSLRPRDAHMRQ